MELVRPGMNNPVIIVRHSPKADRGGKGGGSSGRICFSCERTPRLQLGGGAGGELNIADINSWCIKILMPSIP